MKLTNEQREMICKEYSENLIPSSQLAKKYGVAYQSILTILHKRNIPIRKPQQCSKMNWENSEYRDNHKGTKGIKVVRNDRGLPRPNRQGDKHWNWKGGIAKLSSIIRNHRKYRTWTRTIRERDNNTCQICGVTRINEDKWFLQVDHIYPFCKILKDNTITSIDEALSCEQLWDTTNGRVLCKSCHKATDTYCSKVHKLK